MTVRRVPLSVIGLLAVSFGTRDLGAQCIPFATPTPGAVTPGALVDRFPGAMLLRGHVVDGTAFLVSPFDTYRAVTNIVFPVGQKLGHVNGRGELATPLGVIVYKIKGTVTGDPLTQEFSWALRFVVQGGTGIFQSASGSATYSGTSDADSLVGVTEGVLCLSE